MMNLLTHCDDYLVSIMQYLTIKETCILGSCSKQFYSCSKAAKRLYTQIVVSEADDWTKQEPKASLNSKLLIQHVNDFTSARKIVVLGFESTMYFLLFAFKQSAVAKNITELVFAIGGRANIQPPPKYIKCVFPNLNSILVGTLPLNRRVEFTSLRFDDMNGEITPLYLGDLDFIKNFPQFDLPELREWARGFVISVFKNVLKMRSLDFSIPYSMREFFMNTGFSINEEMEEENYILTENGIKKYLPCYMLVGLWHRLRASILSFPKYEVTNIATYIREFIAIGFDGEDTLLHLAECLDLHTTVAFRGKEFYFEKFVREEIYAHVERAKKRRRTK